MNWLCTVWDYLSQNWQWFIEVPVIVGLAMIRWLICKTIICKPKITILKLDTIGFNPGRSIWGLRIINEKIRGFQRIFCCKRDTLEDCSIEADFYIDNQTPKIAIWDNFDLKPNSNPYVIELISRMHGEDGFYIKKPDKDTFVSARNAKIEIKLKSGVDVVKELTYKIKIYGKWSSDLEFIMVNIK